jgi:predicted RNA-binding protein with PIN domain
MPLLIDGYNLLHASGILGRGIGPGGLERSRTALLNFLAESLGARQLAGTTVVFDARTAPPGLPRQSKYHGMTVRFAERGSDADQEIEQLIAADSAPRRLTVVSSDHRLHRAARRRRAKAIDSDRWYAEILRRRIDRARTRSPTRKPAEPPTEGEVRFWLKQFGLDEVEPPSHSADNPMTDNPFPPGYGEDVLEDDA